MCQSHQPQQPGFHASHVRPSPDSDDPFFGYARQGEPIDVGMQTLVLHLRCPAPAADLPRLVQTLEQEAWRMLAPRIAAPIEGLISVHLGGLDHFTRSRQGCDGPLAPLPAADAQPLLWPSAADLAAAADAFSRPVPPGNLLASVRAVSRGYPMTFRCLDLSFGDLTVLPQDLAGGLAQVPPLLRALGRGLLLNLVDFRQARGDAVTRPTWWRHVVGDAVALPAHYWDRVLRRVG